MLGETSRIGSEDVNSGGFLSIAPTDTLRGVPKGSLGSEIVFADGPQVVDEVYVTPIQRVTDGHPERFPFADVMKRVSDYWTRDHIKQVGARVIREHISQFGLD